MPPLILSRRGVHGIVRREPSDRVKASAVILEQAHRQHADWIVMGGYGHSRLIEALLGGATRTMLTHCPIPLFLAH